MHSEGSLYSKIPALHFDPLIKMTVDPTLNMSEADCQGAGASTRIDDICYIGLIRSSHVEVLSLEMARR